VKTLTLEQIGQQILEASKRLTPAQRQAMSFEKLMARLHTPVGGLKQK
jgi:hypothetical protein